MPVVYFKKAQEVDVTLILEGSYPFIRGGVSSWVQQMINAFPEFTFSLICLGVLPGINDKPVYDLPENVAHAELHYLFEDMEDIPAKPIKGNKKSFAKVRDLHTCFLAREEKEKLDQILDLESYTDPKKGITTREFLYSNEAWKFITEMYEEHCLEPSFIDYFWHVRNMHRPIWTVVHAAKDMPKTKVMHSVSTGYSGFLAALAHSYHGFPLVLTEHGIYTKERRIELLRNYLLDRRLSWHQLNKEPNYFNEMWIGFFESLGYICYESAETITSLYEGARKQQVLDGAPPEKTQIIPNGIDISRFRDCRPEPGSKVPMIVAQIGRVVPIKDIKTYISAISVMKTKIPDIQGWIVGPQDENPEYVEECISFAKTLSIDSNIVFTGSKDLREIFPQVGLVALSSISEGMPLVILEAFAAGIPVVSTQVGSCKDLIEGTDDEDKSLGPAGTVVQIASPVILAEAMAELLQNEEKWWQYHKVAIERCEKYYSEQLMFSRYKDAYMKAMK